MALTPERRARKIASYGGTYERLVEGLGAFPPEMWDFRDEHGCWSIREHLIHIADSEANSYIRCRRFIAEPGRTLMAYDENGWAEALGYAEGSAEDALELFRALRRQSYALIRSLPESVWGNMCYHPENGDMTLDDWLLVYEAHIPEHLGFMRKITTSGCSLDRVTPGISGRRGAIRQAGGIALYCGHWETWNPWHATPGTQPAAHNGTQPAAEENRYAVWPALRMPAPLSGDGD